MITEFVAPVRALMQTSQLGICLASGSVTVTTPLVESTRTKMLSNVKVASESTVSDG